MILMKAFQKHGWRNGGSITPGFKSHFHAKSRSESNETGFDFNDTLSLDCLNGKPPLSVHAIWLRHHCQCNLCFNKQTYQRMKIPSDLPTVSKIIESRCENDDLEVSWNDGHKSSFTIPWLRKYAPKARREEHAFTQEGFINNILETMNMKENFVTTEKTLASPLDSAIPFEDFMKEGDNGVGHLLSSIIKHGYGIVNECPADFETTKLVISKVSHPQNTIFGDFSEWTSNLAHADTAYTNDFVHLHTDTSYFTEPIGLQIFHCLKHEGTGGNNFLADGFQIARQTALNNLEYYKQLSSVDIPSQYIELGKHHFQSNDFILGHDWLSGRIRKIRYNPHDMAVLKAISVDNVAKFYESLVYFSNLLESNPQTIKLKPGIIIFLDNWRILHGRAAFTGFRHLCGAYISRSDWLSRARTIGLLKE